MLKQGSENPQFLDRSLQTDGGGAVSFLGKVDRNPGQVSRQHFINFVKHFNPRFTSAFLGEQAFDLPTGDAYFHFSEV
jgi:hypothetical protein